MQTQSSDEKAVCLSVCLSARPSVCQTRALWPNGRKICPDFHTIRKIIYPSFLRRRMVGGLRRIRMCGQRYSRQGGQLIGVGWLNVFIWRLKVGSDRDSRILTGNEFQNLGAENQRSMRYKHLCVFSTVETWNHTWNHCRVTCWVPNKCTYLQSVNSLLYHLVHFAC